MRTNDWLYRAKVKHSGYLAVWSKGEAGCAVSTQRGATKGGRTLRSVSQFPDELSLHGSKTGVR